MARVKHTKNELKAQREALRRYERFLPMLQLKKQQLQMEIQSIDARLDANRAAAAALQANLGTWVKLFSEPVPVRDAVRIADVVRGETNIAGVTIPTLDSLRLERKDYDLFATTPWLDDAVQVVEQLMRLRIEREILAEQRRLISDELRTTGQRVNLFEKVKIPECRENIRSIRIFIGDQQTAAVARAKFAKNRVSEFEESGAAHSRPEPEATDGPDSENHGEDAP